MNGLLNANDCTSCVHSVNCVRDKVNYLSKLLTILILVETVSVTGNIWYSLTPLKHGWCVFVISLLYSIILLTALLSYLPIKLLQNKFEETRLPEYVHRNYYNKIYYRYQICCGIAVFSFIAVVCMVLYSGHFIESFPFVSAVFFSHGLFIMWLSKILKILSHLIVARSPIAHASPASSPRGPSNISVRLAEVSSAADDGPERAAEMVVIPKEIEITGEAAGGSGRSSSAGSDVVVVGMDDFYDADEKEETANLL